MYVSLTWGWPLEDTENWQIEVIIVRENGRLVVDDVIYLKDKDLAAEYRLSEYLAAGCDGSHWVGDRDQRNDQKPQQK